MNKRIVAALMAIVVAVAMAPADPAAAQATTKPHRTTSQPVGIDSLSPADRAIQQAQEPLLRLNDRVYDVAAGQYDTHFAGASVDIAHRSLIVYWAGPVPSTLAGLRAQAAKSGVALVIKPARFSRTKLMAVAAEILPSAELSASVKLAVDGSGVTVAEGDLPSVVRGVRTATPAESRLLQRIAAVRSHEGVPVTIAAASPGAASSGQMQPATTRENDTSPYWAGAEIENPTGLCGSLNGPCFCTSGFSMYASGSPSTRFMLTTAVNCAGSDGDPITNGSGSAMGHSDFIHELFDTGSPYDLAVVRLDAYQPETNAPKIFLTDDSADGYLSVSGYASGGIPINGTYCIHGMITVSCNLYSGSQEFICVLDDNYCFYTIDFAAKDNVNRIWCLDDSGGPIYYWSGSTVIAAGVASWLRPAEDPDLCALSGGASVVASAVNKVPGLRVVTTSAP